MSTAEESRPYAALSLDLDNLWAYLRTQGDPSWREFPSFLDRAIPRLLDFFDQTGHAITLFAVGRDIEIARHTALFEAVASAGHEIANHSCTHRIDFHRLDADAVNEELSTTEQLIESVGAPRPVGFRGPSFRLSPTVVDVLTARKYVYDASTFPTFVGPLARRFLKIKSAQAVDAGTEHDGVFGSWRDGLRPLKPYRWQCDSRRILELPVTTFPIARAPIHFTYINFIADTSPIAAEAYFKAAMMTCRATGTAPSLLLHATDFVGSQDSACPGFLPGMKRTSEEKLSLLRRLLDRYFEWFDVIPLVRFAAQAETVDGLRTLTYRRAG